MKVKFRYSELGREHEVVEESSDYYILNRHPSNWSDACKIAVKKAAVDLVKEQVYRVGQRIKIDSIDFLITRLNSNKIVLVNLTSGTIFSDPFTPRDITATTCSEIITVIHPWGFVPV